MAKKVKAKTATETTPPVVLKEGPLFSHALGHAEPIRILTEAIRKKRLPGTLLFAGPSGIGKKLVAFGFAQALICERRADTEGFACGKCGPCLRVATGNNENLFYVEPQGAGIKIEQTHEILQFIAFRKLGRARVVIINEAHLLNPQAGNSLLKSLEEPPPETYFVLVTSHPGTLLPTIRSRSQTIRFQALDEKVLRELRPQAPQWLVRSAQGSLDMISKLQGKRDRVGGHETPCTLTAPEFSFWSFKRNRRIPRRDSRTRDRTFRGADVASGVSGFFIHQGAGRPARNRKASSAGSGDTYQIGSNVNLEWLLRLEPLCLELEQDINRNVDRTLAFENFSMAIRRAYSGSEPRSVLR